VPLNPRDYEEIRQTVSKYCWALDFQDFDAFVSCFTPDGSFEGNSHRETLKGAHKGAEQLRNFAKAVSEYTAGHVRHSATNVLIDGDGDAASVISYCQVTRDYGEAYGEGQMVLSKLNVTGIYRDEFRKTASGWLISKRTFRYDGSPEVLGSVGVPLNYTTF
jgi:ketosteroid isomerase-like protein